MHGSAASRRPVASRCAEPVRARARRHRPRRSREPLAARGHDVAGDPGRARLAAAFPAEGQAGHLPVHGRRALPDRDLRRQARAPRAQRRVPARLGPPGAAAHGHVGQPVGAAARRFAVRLLAAWPVRHVGLRLVAAYGPGRRRPLHRPIDAHRRDQPRPCDHVLPDRLADRRPPQHRRVGALRARHRHAGPAGLRRADHARQGGSAAVLAVVGERVPALTAPGRAVPQRQGSGPVPHQPCGRDAAGTPAPAGSAARPARLRRRATRRRRGRRSASRSTRCPTGCRRACPG